MLRQEFFFFFHSPLLWSGRLHRPSRDPDQERNPHRCFGHHHPSCLRRKGCLIVHPNVVADVDVVVVVVVVVVAAAGFPFTASFRRYRQTCGQHVVVDAAAAAGLTLGSAAASSPVAAGLLDPGDRWVLSCPPPRQAPKRWLLHCCCQGLRTYDLRYDGGAACVAAAVLGPRFHAWYAGHPIAVAVVVAVVVDVEATDDNHRVPAAAATSVALPCCAAVAVVAAGDMSPLCCEKCHMCSAADDSGCC